MDAAETFFDLFLGFDFSIDYLLGLLVGEAGF